MQTIKETSTQRRTFLLLCLLSAAAVLALLSSDAIHGRWARPHTIQVSGSRTVVVDDSLRTNPWTAEDFAAEDSGRMRFLSGPYRTGIDVSVFQEEIDWAKVKADGVDFVMVRLGTRSFSDGILRVDQNFANNVKNAAKNGLDVGIYFFSQAISQEEAIEEANFVLKQLQGTPLAIGIAYDWEQVDQDVDEEGISRTATMDKEVLTQCASAFLQRVTEAGYEGILYCNTETGYFGYDLAQFQDYRIWFASYSTGWPNFFYAVDLWQYSDTGKVDGIKGNVDLNLLPLEIDPADQSGSDASASAQGSGSASPPAQSSAVPAGADGQSSAAQTQPVPTADKSAVQEGDAHSEQSKSGDRSAAASQEKSASDAKTHSAPESSPETQVDAESKSSAANQAKTSDSTASSASSQTQEKTTSKNT